VKIGEGERLGAAAARRLAELGCCELAPGLTEVELGGIERRFGFEFADDHRAFLAAGLPVNGPWQPGQTWRKPWPDWRDGDPDELRVHLDWPVEGVVSAVEHGYWDPDWGTRPDVSEAAVAEARQLLVAGPRMVPIYAHRFLPAGRGTFGQPVLSMWGTDIIRYGNDLVDYISREFGKPIP
jgi:hypothetical protein